jgi:steroid delta-isomerase
MPTPDQLRAVADRYCSAAGSGDVEGILACYAEGASVVDPYPAPPRVGTEAIRTMFEERFAMARPVAFLTQLSVLAEDRVAFVFSIEAVTADRSTIAFEGIDIFTVDDEGLIREQIAYWDPTQVRFSPPAGSGGDAAVR